MTLREVTVAQPRADTSSTPIFPDASISNNEAFFEFDFAREKCGLGIGPPFTAVRREGRHNETPRRKRHRAHQSDYLDRDFPIDDLRRRKGDPSSGY